MKVWVLFAYVLSVYSKVLRDGFEGDEEWHMFEELVTSCYGDGIGTIEKHSQSAFRGSSGLTVWANRNRSVYSNHVIAGRNIYDHGVDGKVKYRLRSLMPNGSPDNAQVGPEFSIQNTRSFPNGTTYTSIAGIQYVATKYISTKWNIWVETSPNHASWVPFPDDAQLPQLDTDVWYKFVLRVNFDSNMYDSLLVTSKEGLHAKVRLKNIPIARELRSFAPATVITLEAENLYNNCGTGGVFESKMHYDNVRFKQIH